MLVEQKACCHVANAILSTCRIAANLAHIHAEHVSNVQKCDFWQSVLICLLHDPSGPLK